MPIQQIETAYRLDIRHNKLSSFPAWSHDFEVIPTGTLKIIIIKTGGNIEVMGVKSGNIATFTPTLSQMQTLANGDYAYEARIIEGAEIDMPYIYGTLTIF